MSDVTVGLDPALNSIGVAILVDGELVDCFRFRPPAKLRGVKATKLEIGDRVREVGRLLVEAIGHRDIQCDPNDGRAGSKLWLCPSNEGPCDLWIASLVYEWPQIYGVGVSRVDPNDLPPLAGIGAHVAARTCAAAVVRSPMPREWTGGTSKNVDGSAKDSSRWRRLERILTPREIALVPDEHDVIDAIGLALHDTPRALATPRQKFPGASPRRSSG